ncbi:MarR family transcriptional regulator [Paenibacillus sp. M1]|uniref:MarR family transcriptional regulator n=1 Tax=Paenibacillus haidiansis TaxID=1574488 RepID=A0ABU7VXQ4_9BACL
MNVGEEPKARRLLEVFSRFRKLRWHHDEIVGFKPSEIRVLFFIQMGCLKEERGIPVSKISSKMHVTSPTVTPLVKSLESQGLVVRNHDQEDRRVVRVKLTEEGEKLCRDLRASQQQSFKELMEYLGPERIDQLADLLEMVFRFMEEKRKQDAGASSKRESGDDGE